VCKSYVIKYYFLLKFLSNEREEKFSFAFIIFSLEHLLFERTLQHSFITGQREGRIEFLFGKLREKERAGETEEIYVRDRKRKREERGREEKRGRKERERRRERGGKEKERWVSETQRKREK